MNELTRHTTSEAQYACGECGKPLKTGCYCIECMVKAMPPDPILRIRRSALIRTDSYGVHGSDFSICRLCDGESSPGRLNKGIQHQSDCPLGRYEARVAKRHRSDETITGEKR